MAMYKHKKYLEKDDPFGELLILYPDDLYNVGKTPSKWKYYCKCICGNIKSYARTNLLEGDTSSCGCLRNTNKRKTNEIEQYGEYLKILFFNCDKFAIIDKEDYDKIKNYCWHGSSPAKGIYYAKATVRNGSDKSIKMHQIIFPCLDNYYAEHKDGDGLNNRKNNLRQATHSQNVMNQHIRSDNTSGVKGVSWSKNHRKWCSYITVNQKRINIGMFTDKENAISARVEKELELFGEFSYLNRKMEE